VFVDLQKPGADKTVFFGGPIFWARAVAADTESDTVYDLVCGLKDHIDDPSNKEALDVVKDNNQYKRFCEYLEAATLCLSEKTRAILTKRKQMVLTQQLGMYPLVDPEDVDGGSIGRLQAEFTSSPLPLLEAAVSGGTYKAAPENIGAPNRRAPVASQHESAKSGAPGTLENSGGRAESGGGGEADGADAEREPEANGDELGRTGAEWGTMVMSWEEMVINESLSDHEKETWQELETLCKSGVCDDIDIEKFEKIIAKLENPLMRQKMWEWVKLAHKEIYDTIEKQQKKTGRTTPEPEDGKGNRSTADNPGGGEEKEEEESDEEEDSTADNPGGGEEGEEEDGKTQHNAAATRGTKRGRSE
jgi:hypothetical protein